MDEDWIHSPNAIHEIGSIHATIGYDLNYAGVIFGRDKGGTRQGGIVIIQSPDIQDSDFGSGYTIKQYHSEKRPIPQPANGGMLGVAKLFI